MTSSFHLCRSLLPASARAESEPAAPVVDRHQHDLRLGHLDDFSVARRAAHRAGAPAFGLDRHPHGHRGAPDAHGFRVEADDVADDTPARGTPPRASPGSRSGAPQPSGPRPPTPGRCCDRITPPKMVPCALVSLGRSKSLMAGIRTVINLHCRSNHSSTGLAPRSFDSDCGRRRRPKNVFVTALKLESMCVIPLIMTFNEHVTNGRPAPPRRARRPRARGACTTPASSTMCRAGATATSRSTRRAPAGPSDQGSRARDRPEGAVDRLQLRGIGLPVLSASPTS